MNLCLFADHKWNYDMFVFHAPSCKVYKISNINLNSKAWYDWKKTYPRFSGVTVKALDQRQVPGRLSCGSPSCPLIWSLLSLQYQLKTIMIQNIFINFNQQIDRQSKLYTWCSLIQGIFTKNFIRLSWIEAEKITFPL